MGLKEIDWKKTGRKLAMAGAELLVLGQTGSYVFSGLRELPKNPSPTKASAFSADISIPTPNNRDAYPQSNKALAADSDNKSIKEMLKIKTESTELPSENTVLLVDNQLDVM